MDCELDGNTVHGPRGHGFGIWWFARDAEIHGRMYYGSEDYMERAREGLKAL